MKQYLNNMFKSYGKLLSRYPYLFLFIGIALPAVLISGFSEYKMETRIDKLWIEKGGLVEQETNYVDTHTVPFTGITNEIFTTTSDNILMSQLL